MALTENELHTRQMYDEKAEDWLEHSGGRNRPCFWAEEMTQFMALLDGDKKILEVGCGPATDGKYLEASGAAMVLSTDYSETMLAIARKLNPEGYFMKMDMQDLDIRYDSFDGFWATACLLHLENPTIALKELVRVTKNKGVGFITIKEGVGEIVDERTGYYFKYYQDGNFQKLLSENSMQVIAAGRKAGTPNHDYLTYLVRVNK
jgi:ubiquinone/menaquinone biosynthesis C-methylase UbiE